MLHPLKVCSYLIAAQITVSINGLSVTYFQCDYEEKTVIKCKPPHIDETKVNNTLMRLPDDLPNSIKHLDIFSYLTNGTSIGTRLPVELDDIDIFRRFTSLQFLLIIGSELEISEELRQPKIMNLFKKELFNIPGLKVLAVSIVMPTLEPNIADNMQWILPKNLVSFGVEKTVMDFDLRACSKLEEIFVSSSPLTKLPPLHVPDPPIKRLRLAGCPLSELAVEDVARFCRLENFSIYSFDEPFNVLMDECECFKLLQWIEKLTRVGRFHFSGELPCAGVPVDDELCHNSSLSEAVRLRMECLGEGAFAILFFGVAIFSLPFVFAFSVFIRSFKKTHQKPITRSASSSVNESVMEMTPNSSNLYEEDVF